jgi:YggT family protein
MAAVIEFVFAVIDALLTAIIWIVIANAIVSWLIAFDVVNMRNRAIYSIVRFLDAVTRPVLVPFRRIVPTFGGVDITPVLLIIIVAAAQRYLLPALETELIKLVAPEALIGPQ